MKAGISRRFEEINNRTDAQLAAVAHPRFKLYWINGEVQKERLFDYIEITIDVMIEDEDKTSDKQMSSDQLLHGMDEWSTNIWQHFPQKLRFCCWLGRS